MKFKRLLCTLCAGAMVFGTLVSPIGDSGVFDRVSIGVSAESLYYNGYSYQVLDNGTIEITKYTGSDTKISIPSEIDGKKVTSIGNSAFYNCSSLTSITIPNSVTSIGYFAFWNCTSLTSITIPDSVTSIGDHAFLECTSLTSVTIPNSVTSIGDGAFCGCISLTSITIPNSVTSIGDHAFYGCTSLTSINVDSDNKSYTSIDGVLYNKPTTELIICPPGKKSITIPNSVTSIGESAFSDCTSLTSITIPNSVKSIGSYAFSGCSSLTSVTIPNKIPFIGTNAFSGTPWLKDNGGIIFMAGVYYMSDGTWNFRHAYESIPEDDCVKATFPNAGVGVQGGEYGFDTNAIFNDVVIFNKSGTKATYTITGALSGTINYPNQEYYDGTEISGDALNWSVAKNYEMKDGEVIDGSTFTGFNQLGITTDIPSDYFDDVKAKIEFSDVIVKYGENTYTVADPIIDCSSDSLNIVITNRWDKNYKEYVATDRMIAYTAYATPGKDDIIEITFSVKIMDKQQEYKFDRFTYKYQNDWSIKITKYNGADNNITIPSKIDGKPVTSIDSAAFKDCTNLTSITIPNNVTSIGDDAFRGCTSLTSITIPNSVKSIGESAFSCCTSLTSITIPNSVTSIGDSAFRGCKSLTSITIPNSVTYICYNAFWSISRNAIIYGYTGTEAETYAKNNYITFVALDAENPHIHSYTSSVTKKATCTVAGVRTYTCTCGDSYSEPISATGHKYTSKVVSPTYTAQGYTLHTCSVCGYSYKDNYKAKLTRKSITSATVTGITNKTYTGKALTQTPVVKLSGKTLKSGTDYTVTYQNNKAVGTATVKITGKGSYTGTITRTFKIQLANVSGFKNVAVTANSIKFTWNKVAGADGYVVYLYNKSAKAWKRVAKTTSNTYLVSKLNSGEAYALTARAYKTVSGKEVLSPSFTNYKTSTNPAKVSFSVTSKSKGAVTYTWKKVTGATSYAIYYKATSGASWKRVATVGNTKTSYTKTGLKSGTGYFTVRAYRTYEGKSYGSAFDTKSTKVK